MKDWDIRHTLACAILIAWVPGIADQYQKSIQKVVILQA